MILITRDSPSVFDILVDKCCYDDGYQSVVPADQEHEYKAEQSSDERGCPVIEPEPRTPVRSLQD